MTQFIFSVYLRSSAQIRVPSAFAVIGRPHWNRPKDNKHNNNVQVYLVFFYKIHILVVSAFIRVNLRPMFYRCNTLLLQRELRREDRPGPLEMALDRLVVIDSTKDLTGYLLLARLIRLRSPFPIRLPMTVPVFDPVFEQNAQFLKCFPSRPALLSSVSTVVRMMPVMVVVHCPSLRSMIMPEVPVAVDMPRSPVHMGMLVNKIHRQQEFFISDDILIPAVCGDAPMFREYDGPVGNIRRNGKIMGG